jgi:branched-chain amino acid transport system ATP-binding protein
MKSIKVKNLTKCFGEVKAVDSASFKILPGKVTGFLGPNGAGKTTLFHLISNDLKPDAGKIFLFDEDKNSGTDLVHLKRHEIADLGIGKLFQDIKIFDNLSVIENVMLGLFTKFQRNPTWSFFHFREQKKINAGYQERALKSLQFVGLYHELGELVFKKKARELSFGQQKLLSFARLMAMDFDILLLDEPTAGVNEFLVKKIEGFIQNFVGLGKTVAVIEHNVKVMEKVADFIYFMEDGRIEFFGKTEHILNNQEIRQRYIGIDL